MTAIIPYSRLNILEPNIQADVDDMWSGYLTYYLFENGVSSL